MLLSSNSTYHSWQTIFLHVSHRKRNGSSLWKSHCGSFDEWTTLCIIEFEEMLPIGVIFPRPTKACCFVKAFIECSLTQSGQKISLQSKHLWTEKKISKYAKLSLKKLLFYLTSIISTMPTNIHTLWAGRAGVCMRRSRWRNISHFWTIVTRVKNIDRVWWIHAEIEIIVGSSII